MRAVAARRRSQYANEAWTCATATNFLVKDASAPRNGSGPASASGRPLSTDATLQTFLTEQSGLRRLLLRVGGYYSASSQRMRGARATFEAATEAAENPQLASALGFLPSSADPRSISTFQHSHALFILHVWLALGRLRSPEIADRELAQILYDRFQDDVERRVRAAGVRVRVGKHLAELERQFYGSAAAYDAALKSGSVVAGLTAALRRNVFLLEAREEAQPRALALYALHQQACLAMTPVEDVVAGNYKFDQGVLLS